MDGVSISPEKFFGFGRKSGYGQLCICARGRASPPPPVLAVTPTPHRATYVFMEVTDGLLAALLAAWRVDIDSVPYAHESESETIVQALLSQDDPVI
jgi:hypothetical protein